MRNTTLHHHHPWRLHHIYTLTRHRRALDLDHPEVTLPRTRFQLAINKHLLPRLNRTLRNVNSASEGQPRDGRSRTVINVALEEGIEVEKGESGIEGRSLTMTATPNGVNELDTIIIIDDATDPGSSRTMVPSLRATLFYRTSQRSMFLRVCSAISLMCFDSMSATIDYK